MLPAVPKVLAGGCSCVKIVGIVKKQTSCAIIGRLEVRRQLTLQGQAEGGAEGGILVRMAHVRLGVQCGLVLLCCPCVAVDRVRCTFTFTFIALVAGLLLLRILLEGLRLIEDTQLL